jgi:Spy/CpxP family protein refolding chaperone
MRQGDNDMKRALILITLLTAIAVSAAAQPGPPPPHRDVLADYLQLTDAQKSQWQAAHAEFEAAMKAAHDALETKLASTLTPEQKTKFEAFKAARELLQPQGPRPQGGPGRPPR